MWLDRVSNPGPLALESDMLPTGLHGPVLLFNIPMPNICESNTNLLS